LTCSWHAADEVIELLLVQFSIKGLCDFGRIEVTHGVSSSGNAFEQPECAIAGIAETVTEITLSPRRQIPFLGRNRRVSRSLASLRRAC